MCLNFGTCEFPLRSEGNVRILLDPDVLIAWLTCGWPDHTEMGGANLLWKSKTHISIGLRVRFPSKPTITFPHINHINATMHFRAILATAVLLFVSNVLGTPAPQAETLCEYKYSSSEPLGTQELFIVHH